MAHLPQSADVQKEPVKGVPASNGGPIEKPAAPKMSVSGLNRPPKPPGTLIGPFLGFTTTTSDKVWRGTALTLHRNGQHSGRPQLTFDHEIVASVAGEAVEVLYDDVFGMTALRWNLAFTIPEGAGDEIIRWTLEWPEAGIQKKENKFHIAKWNQRWRGGAFSCAGFDETVPDETVKLFGFDSVWKHLNSVHELTPMHVLVYGGDQIYIDLIFQDIPWLADWLKLEWKEKWTREFSEDVSEQAAQHWFNTYSEVWCLPENRKALETVPAVMQWDDHDIFDGAGSYPPECHDSPVMLGLVRTAQKFRLLFQHHTTPDLARKHGYFGKHGHNSILQLGPSIAMLNIDGRTERNHEIVMEPETWQMIFERLEKVPSTTQHLLCVFAVPFSFIRARAAEALFSFLAAKAPWVRQLPGVKSMNSIFDLCAYLHTERRSPHVRRPEFYDDLLDEWCAKEHIDERNDVLVKLQNFAANHSIRVTFIGGDVHCAGAARFRSSTAERQRLKLTPKTDSKLMMSFISSAIVNQSPSPNACIGYHYVANKWKPVKDTVEELVEMFERRPEGGKHVRHRKVMPNRNWLFFEMVGQGESGSSTQPGGVNLTVQADDDSPHKHQRLHRHGHKHAHALLEWSRDHYAFDKKRGYPSTLGPTSAKNGQGADGDPLHQHEHGFFCHHRKSRTLNPEVATKKATGETVADKEQPETAPTGLLVRMWLESRQREATKTRQFASYQVVIPDLVVGDKAKSSSS